VCFLNCTIQNGATYSHEQVEKKTEYSCICLWNRTANELCGPGGIGMLVCVIDITVALFKCKRHWSLGGGSTMFHEACLNHVNEPHHRIFLMPIVSCVTETILYVKISLLQWADSVFAWYILENICYKFLHLSSGRGDWPNLCFFKHFLSNKGFNRVMRVAVQFCAPWHTCCL